MSYIKDLCRYKYIEKKSLIEYYKLFQKNITNGEIYRYLNLHPAYFKNKDYRRKYDKMLHNFSLEIENYVNYLDK